MGAWLAESDAGIILGKGEVAGFVNLAAAAKACVCLAAVWLCKCGLANEEYAGLVALGRQDAKPVVIHFRCG